MTETYTSKDIAERCITSIIKAGIGGSILGALVIPYWSLTLAKLLLIGYTLHITIRLLTIEVEQQELSKISTERLKGKFHTTDIAHKGKEVLAVLALLVLLPLTGDFTVAGMLLGATFVEGLYNGSIHYGAVEELIHRKQRNEL